VVEIEGAYQRFVARGSRAAFASVYLPEYNSPLALLIFCLAAPAIFAGCFYLGGNRFDASRKTL
jgi:hypothetical protein